MDEVADRLERVLGQKRLDGMANDAVEVAALARVMMRRVERKVVKRGGL